MEKIILEIVLIISIWTRYHYISNPNNPAIKEENNNISNISTTSEIKNSDKHAIWPIIDPKSSNDIKETNIVKPISSYTESKSAGIESDDEIKSDKIIIESSITPITSLEETENPKETIPNFISYNKDDDNKTNTIAIVFASIGGIVILGGIIGYVIYYKKKIANIADINTETSIAKINIKS